MKYENQFKLKLSSALKAAAHETARQRGEKLTTIVRHYLEAYAATRPTK